MAKTTKFKRDPLERIVADKVDEISKSADTIEELLDGILQHFDVYDTQNEEQTEQMQRINRGIVDANDTLDDIQDSLEDQEQSEPEAEEEKEIDLLFDDEDEPVPVATQEPSVSQVAPPTQDDKLNEVRATETKTVLQDPTPPKSDNSDVEAVSTAFAGLTESVTKSHVNIMDKLTGIGTALEAWWNKYSEWIPFIVLGFLTIMRLGQMLYQYVTSGAMWSDVKSSINELKDEILDIRPDWMRSVGTERGDKVSDEAIAQYGLEEGKDYKLSGDNKIMTQSGADKVAQVKQHNDEVLIKNAMNLPFPTDEELGLKSIDKSTPSPSTPSTKEKPVKARISKSDKVASVNIQAPSESTPPQDFASTGGVSFTPQSTENQFTGEMNNSGAVALDASSVSNNHVVNNYVISRVENTDFI